MDFRPSEETLFILNVLYKRRNIHSSRGFHSEKMRSLYNKKFPNRESLSFKEAIKILKNSCYITVIKKKEEKYYISDITGVHLILRSYGYISDDGL